MLSVVAPNITWAFGKEIGVLLGKVLLFAIIKCPDCVPKSIVKRVTMEMERQQMALSVNPIQRVSFVVVQEDDQCVLHDIGGETNGTAVSSVGNIYNNAAAGLMDAVLTMLASIRTQTQQQNSDLRTHLDGRLDAIARDIAAIKLQVQHAATIPAFRLGSAPGRRSEEGQVAKLVDRPKTLEVIWREYVSGVNGTKPAREYNDADRAKNSTKFCRRKVLWDIVSDWVWAGKTPEQAMAVMYRLYHPVVSVSRILDGLAKKKKTGGHPELRI